MERDKTPFLTLNNEITFNCATSKLYLWRLDCIWLLLNDTGSDFKASPISYIAEAFSFELPSSRTPPNSWKTKNFSKSWTIFKDFSKSIKNIFSFRNYMLYHSVLDYRWVENPLPNFPTVVTNEEKKTIITDLKLLGFISYINMPQCLLKQDKVRNVDFFQFCELSIIKEKLEIHPEIIPWCAATSAPYPFLPIFSIFLLSILYHIIN